MQYFYTDLPSNSRFGLFILLNNGQMNPCLNAFADTYVSELWYTDLIDQGHSQHATNMQDASRLLLLASGVTIANPTSNIWIGGALKNAALAFW